MIRVQKAVGFCYNEFCDAKLKGTFLLNHGPRFYCPSCRAEGETVSETTEVIAGANSKWKEVRVEFDYDPVDRRFRAVAIVKDNSILGQGNKFLFKSPLVKTEKRALVMAESFLANLQNVNFLNSGESVRANEKVIYFDSDKSRFMADLADLSEYWHGLKI